MLFSCVRSFIIVEILLIFRQKKVQLKLGKVFPFPPPVGFTSMRTTLFRCCMHSRSDNKLLFHLRVTHIHTMAKLEWSVAEKCRVDIFSLPLALELRFFALVWPWMNKRRFFPSACSENKEEMNIIKIEWIHIMISSRVAVFSWYFLLSLPMPSVDTSTYGRRQWSPFETTKQGKHSGNLLSFHDRWRMCKSESPINSKLDAKSRQTQRETIVISVSGHVRRRE